MAALHHMVKPPILTLPVTANSNNRLPATVAFNSNRTILKLATVKSIQTRPQLMPSRMATLSQILGAPRATVSNSSRLALTLLLRQLLSLLTLLNSNKSKVLATVPRNLSLNRSMATVPRNLSLNRSMATVPRNLSLNRSLATVPRNLSLATEPRNLSLNCSLATVPRNLNRSLALATVLAFLPLHRTCP